MSKDMSDLRKAAEKAAEWMEWWLNNDECECESGHHCGKNERIKELNNLKEALAQPEQEPVAWVITSDPSGDFSEPRVSFHTEKPDCSAFPLYTKPQPLRRLSDGEIDDLIHPLIKDIPMPLVNKVFTIMRKSAKAIQDAIEKLNQ